MYEFTIDIVRRKVIKMIQNETKSVVNYTVLNTCIWTTVKGNKCFDTTGLTDLYFWSHSTVELPPLRLVETGDRREVSNNLKRSKHCTVVEDRNGHISPILNMDRPYIYKVERCYLLRSLKNLLPLYK